MRDDIKDIFPDEELSDIIEKMESMFYDMYDHYYRANSELYGGITFKEFQHILYILHEQSGKEYDEYEWIGFKGCD